MEYKESYKTVDELLKESLIDYALDSKNIEMLKALSSQGWENNLVKERPLKLDRLERDIIPEYDFNYYHTIRGRGKSLIESFSEFQEIKKEMSVYDTVTTVPDIRSVLRLFCEKYNPNLKITNFLKRLCDDLEITSKLKIVTNTKYRTVSYYVSNQKLLLVTYNEYLQSLTEDESLDYLKEKAETICIYLTKPNIFK